MKKGIIKQELIIVLPDIRSVYNVGAIFRTADAIGASKIYLTGITPQPKDRFGRVRQDIAKAALGSENTVDWEWKKSATNLIKKLKSQGYHIIALEQSKKSVDYKKVKPTGKSVFVVGNEVLGVSKKILDLSDIIVEIPMRGKKESLNVSVSFGIALFRIFDR